MGKVTLDDQGLVAFIWAAVEDGDIDKAHRAAARHRTNNHAELVEALRDTADMLRRQHTVAPGHVSNAEKVNAMLERARKALSLYGGEK